MPDSMLEFKYSAWLALILFLMITGCSLHYDTGKELESEGRYDEASIEYHRAFVDDPDDLEIQEALQRVHRKVAEENLVRYREYLEKNQYHKENMLSAELVLVNIKEMPQTHEGLRDWVIEKSKTDKYLLYTDVAKDVQEIIAGGPVPTHIKPIWPFIAFTAFNTLPHEFKEIYGVKDSKFKSFILGFNLAFLKYSRPFLPPFFRLIAPARWAKQRLNKNPNLLFKDKAKF